MSQETEKPQKMAEQEAGRVKVWLRKLTYQGKQTVVLRVRVCKTCIRQKTYQQWQWITKNF